MGAALVSVFTSLRPSLVVHALALVDQAAFEAHDNGAGGTHGVVRATRLGFGHNRVAVSNRTPLEVSPTSSDKQTFFLVLPHVQDPWLAKSFDVGYFEFLGALLLQASKFLLVALHACHQMILNTVNTKTVAAL